MGKPARRVLRQAKSKRNRYSCCPPRFKQSLTEMDPSFVALEEAAFTRPGMRVRE